MESTVTAPAFKFRAVLSNDEGLRLDGDITPEQFRVRSATLGEARAAAEVQLEAARSRLFRLKDIKLGKDALASHYSSPVPRGLADLPRLRKIGSTR
jgi:hypothetical protein